MLFAIVLLLTIGCIAFVLVRGARGTPRPGGLRGRIRDRGWALLLLPVAMSSAVMAGGAYGLIPAELGLAALAIVFAPELAARLVPYGVLGLAVFGVMLARTYHDGNTSQVQYLFVPGLAALGFEVYPPQGTYFVTADISGLDDRDGVEFCRTLPERAGVVAIPSAIFYDDKQAARTLVRFAFCKRPEVLTEALTRLSRLTAS